jgi:hypothetical protein
MIDQTKLIYVGVDLHKQNHTAVIIDCWSKKLGEIKFDNKPSAFPLLVKEVKKYMKKGLTVVYGLEDVGGYGRGLAVYLKDNQCRQEEGKTKQQAIICIMRKLVNIIYAMMKNKSAYLMPTVPLMQTG